MANSNGHYLTRSVADSGFIVADSELGDFKVENLLTPQADLAYRGDSTNVLLIQGNLNQFELIDTLAICLHNMTSAALVVAEFYDSRSNSPLLTVSETIGGTDTIPAYKNKILEFQEVSALEFDITITDLDNPDGYVQIRRLKMGIMTKPDTGFDFGSTFGFIAGEGYRGGEIRWSWKTEEGLNDVNELVRDYGVDPDRYARTRAGELLGFDDDILWLGYPDATNSRTLEQHTALVALVGADLPDKPNPVQGIFVARFEEIFYPPTIAPGTAFITIWKTTGAAESITLPTPGVNSFVVDWGDGTAKELVVNPSYSHVYADAGEYVVTIEGICRKWYQNDAGDKTKIIGLSQWGNVGFTELNAAFHGCSNMIITATDTPDVAAITSFSYTFSGCTVGASYRFSRWIIGAATDMSFMFYLSDLDTTDYDAILISWEAQAHQSSVTFHAGTAKFTGATAASVARYALVDDSWVITDGGGV